MIIVIKLTRPRSLRSLVNRGTSLVFKILGFAESVLGYDKEGPTALVRIS